MPSAEYLLVDLSNSFAKIAPSTRERVGRVRKVRTADLGVKTLHRYDAETVVLCSVVPQKERFLLRHFRDRRVLRVDHRVQLGIAVDFPDPSKIGADRLANASAAAHLYGTPAVVVDFGTAVTFDIVSAGRAYVGGVIAPGLEVMTDYLYQRTALLPKIDLAEPVSPVGKSTRDAMVAGAVYGYRGLVREILWQIRKALALRKPPFAVATGGYAELIAAKLPEIEVVHPGLTLEGLRIIGNLNPA